MTITRLEILMITTAYEQGVGKGYKWTIPTINPYAKDTPCYIAWELGYEEGKDQSKKL